MIGTLLNERFRLEEKIGSGGMSTVYRACDPTLERWVAIKLMHRDISEEPDQLERFRREARAVARLSHPHVVTVIDFGEDDGTPYIVLEYVEGETLKDRIKRMGRLPVAEAVAYAIEIGRALTCAHTAHLVHRDVKPQNVLIDMEGRAKVTDFGIARSLEVDVAGLTADGRVLGTTDYVSPEQALGKEVTEQSDVYSLGIVMFEMLTGEVPFRAESQVAVAMKHVKEPMPDVQRIRPEVSATLASVVEHATAKELDNRYATAEDMTEDLEEVLAIEVARAGEAGSEATTRAARAGQRHQGLRARAAAQPAPVAAVGAGRADPGRRRRGLLRLAHREGRRAARDPAARRPDRGAAGLQRRERLRPRGRRPRVARVAPERRWTATRRPSGTPSATTAASRAWARPAWACSWTPAGPVDGARPEGHDVDARVHRRRVRLERGARRRSTAGRASASRPGSARSRPSASTTPGRYRRYLLWITKLPEGNKAALQEVNLYR